MNHIEKILMPRHKSLLDSHNVNNVNKNTSNVINVSDLTKEKLLELINLKFIFIAKRPEVKERDFLWDCDELVIININLNHKYLFLINFKTNLLLW